MIELDEFEIVQNKVFCCHILWEFVKFYEKSKEGIGPKMIQIFPVLPIVLNKEASNSIKNRRFNEGSFYKVIFENKSILGGLQLRMEDMSDLTLHSLNLAFAMELLGIDKTSFNLFSRETKNPNFDQSNDYNDIILATRRLGTWFAKISPNEMMSQINITF